MKTNKKNERRKSKQETHRDLPGQIPPAQKKRNAAAHHQAEKDMVDDAELVARNKNDDLDEGETARLGKDTDLI